MRSSTLKLQFTLIIQVNAKKLNRTLNYISDNVDSKAGKLCDIVKICVT